MWKDSPPLQPFELATSKHHIYALKKTIYVIAFHTMFYILHGEKGMKKRAL